MLCTFLFAAFIYEAVAITTLRVTQVEKIWTDIGNNRSTLQVNIDYEISSWESVEFYLHPKSTDPRNPVEQWSERDAFKGRTFLRVTVMPDDIASVRRVIGVEFISNDVTTTLHIPTHENNPGRSIITTQGVLWAEPEEFQAGIGDQRAMAQRGWRLRTDVNIEAHIACTKVVRLGNGEIGHELKYEMVENEANGIEDVKFERHELQTEEGWEHWIVLELSAMTEGAWYQLTVRGMSDPSHALGFEVAATFQLTLTEEDSLFQEGEIGLAFVGFPGVHKMNQTHYLAETAMFSEGSRVFVVECYAFGDVIDFIELYKDGCIISAGNSSPANARLDVKRKSPNYTVLDYVFYESQTSASSHAVYTCLAYNKANAVRRVLEHRIRTGTNTQ